MSHSNGRIYIETVSGTRYGVSMDDIGITLGRATRDEGQLCFDCDANGDVVNSGEGTINKWAKWKPVKGSGLDIATRDLRRRAGRTNNADATRQYGVHASGFGNADITLDDIHGCQFIYERPSASANDKARALDFADPGDSGGYPSGNGYNANAYLDFIGTLPSNTLIKNGESALGDFELEYDPHDPNSTAGKEMLSITDFLVNDSGQITYDLDDMYPCILITQGGYHFIHCLTPDRTSPGTSAPYALGDALGNEWHLNTNGMPYGNSTGQLHPNQTATCSLFLCSEETLEGPNTGTDITSWIVKSTSNPGSGQAWVSWFCPVPDACGIECWVGQAQTGVQVIVTNIDFNADCTLLNVTYSVVNPASSSDFSIRAEVSTYGTTKAIIIRSNTYNGTVAFNVPADFDNYPFAPNTSYTFTASALKNGTTQNSKTVTLTYHQ